MQVATLTVVAFHLNRAIESGRHDAVTVDEVRHAVHTGAIVHDLRRWLGPNDDLTFVTAAVEVELLAEWQDMEITVDLVHAFGIERRGLCLLMAFLIEGIRRRALMAPWACSAPAQIFG